MVVGSLCSNDMLEVSLKQITKTGDMIRANINQTDIILVFNYIERYDYWCIDFYKNTDDEPFLAGIRCNVNQDLFAPFIGLYDGVPPASLQLLSNDKTKQEVKGDDMEQGNVVMGILLPEEMI